MNARLRLPSFVLIALLALPAAGQAISVVGFGDSITDRGFDAFPDGSYLDWLGPAFSGEDVATPAALSSEVLVALEDWLDLGSTADIAVILSGTPDASQAPGFFGGSYDENATVTNIAMMVSLLDGAGIPSIVLTPLPVLAPCDNVELDGGPSCAQFDTRLFDLSGRLASESLGDGFADLYAAFDAESSGGSNPWLLGDGVHPKVLGDQAIADAVRPLILTLVPEPGSALLLGAGLAALGAGRRQLRA